MKLRLDHTQRLNLHALLGTQRGDLAAIRALWALRDKLPLSPQEEKAINLRRESVAGHERFVCDPALVTAPKEVDFTESEAARIRVVLESWDQYNAAADRRWLEPLLNLLASRPAPLH